MRGRPSRSRRTTIPRCTSAASVPPALSAHIRSSAKFFIINAPWTFTTIWSFVKLWLAPRTIEKIDIIGGDYQGVLLEQIDAENLPAFYGGKCECKDVGGCKWSVPMLEGR